jgi:hypothetical protein
MPPRVLLTIARRRGIKCMHCKGSTCAIYSAAPTWRRVPGVGRRFVTSGRPCRRGCRLRQRHPASIHLLRGFDAPAPRGILLFKLLLQHLKLRTFQGRCRSFENSAVALLLSVGGLCQRIRYSSRNARVAALNSLRERHQQATGNAFAVDGCVHFVGSLGVSAVDHIHKIAGGIAKKETAKSPVFRSWPVHHFRPCRANGGLRGIQILYAD